MSGLPSRALFRHRWIQTAPKVRLHVVEAGPVEGPPVILLHGFPEYWYGWRHQIPALARAGYRIIVPDQRGYHRSDKPTRVSAYRLRHLIDDVRVLINETQYPRADVIGHDWGAMVAWTLAACSPDSVRRLGILNVPHPHVMLQTLKTDPAQRIRSLYAAFFQLPRVPEWTLTYGDCALLTMLLRMSSQPGTFSASELLRYRASWRQPGSVRSMLNWYRAAFRSSDLRTMPADPIRPPTLVIWGKRDVALKASMAPASIARCTNGRLVMLPDATHWVQHDAVERVNSELLTFLSD